MEEVHIEHLHSDRVVERIYTDERAQDGADQTFLIRFGRVPDGIKVVHEARKAAEMFETGVIMVRHGDSSGLYVEPEKTRFV